MHSKTTVLLIGAGRLAKHLKFWNSKLENPNTLICWDRTQNISILEQCLVQKPLVWLAISDSSIVEFYEKYLQKYNLSVVHFSGALNDTRLFAAHPLMTFPVQLFESETYQKIHFVLTGVENLKTAMPNFKNTFSLLKSENRAFYHALCVLAGNFPQILWSEVHTEMKTLGVPDYALEIYIQQVANNFINLKKDSITGPLARKDYNTIEKNISALAGYEKLQNTYKCFAKEFGK